MKTRPRFWWCIIAVFTAAALPLVAQAPLTGGTLAAEKGGFFAENSQAVKRLYINISESEKIVFPKPVEEYRATFPGVAKLEQPMDNILLVEGIRVGRTTITVISGDQIYRFHVTTFEGRGADEANINNEFSEQGLVDLTARFDKKKHDQVLIEGNVETPEQLAQASQIVKKYTPFFINKAAIGKLEVDVNTSTPEEQEIEKTIEKLAGVPNLKVKVKFELRQKEVSITESATTGNPVVTNTSTSANGASSTSTAPLVPPDSQGKAPEPEPTKGTLEQSTVSQLEGVPAKIFLYGNVRDDLERSKAIRVARTFCTLVVSFLTLDDPIQVRFQCYWLDVNLTKARNVGVQWPNSLTYRALNAPAATAQTGTSSMGTMFRKVFSGEGSKLMENITAGLTANADVTMNMLETIGVSRVMQAPVVTVFNGQTGFFRSGGQFPVQTTTLNADGTRTNATVYRDFGISISILPMNLERSGPDGLTEDILNSDGTRSIPTMMDVKGIVNPIGRNNFTLPPEVDESLKMVDENGNIAVRLNTQVSALDFSQVDAQGNPQIIDKQAVTRAVLKDGEPLVVAGVMDQNYVKTVRKIPFLGDIPFFGELFKNRNAANDDVREIIFVLRPKIVRAKSSSLEDHFPKPFLDENRKAILQVAPDLVPTLNGRPKPYESKESKGAPMESSRFVPSNEGSAVEAVPLIDVTPATPVPAPLKPATTPTPPSVVPMELKDEAAPSASSPAAPMTPSVEKPAAEATEPAKIKEGPKTRTRPEAPDDSAILKEQPQTSRLKKKPTIEVRNP